MMAFASAGQAAHQGLLELTAGRLVASWERPERADVAQAAFLARGLGTVHAAADHGLAPILAVHDAQYVEFLRGAWPAWQAAGHAGPALPMVWQCAQPIAPARPQAIEGLLGFHAQDAACCIVAGTWDAAYGSAQAALAAASAVLAGAPAALALCRPPGHHAARAAMGGFCYLNNAAIAAQHLRAQGAQRVAVLDIDYHHGNGTQSIFWDRADVFVGSLHADPRHDYPYLCGNAGERGGAAAHGANLNVPLPLGTAGPAWRHALDGVLRELSRFRPDALVVSAGLDGAAGDPVGHFLLEEADYARAGRAIAALALPTVFVLEGGYHLERLGDDLAHLLEGFGDGSTH